jgi:Fe2+ transport system protein B
MTRQPSLVQPPRIAVWVVNLFAPSEEAESISGDLQEEFAQVASKSGAAVARSWYWRQAVKTIVDLAASGLSSAPWSTTAAVVAGFFLHGFVHGLPDKLLAAVTDRYLAYWSTHFKAYMFCATDGMFIAHVIASVFVGCIVALAVRGRELVATVMLAVVLGMLGFAASLVWLARTGDMWMLALRCADSFAIVVGGVIIRARKPAPTTLPSQT